MKFQSQAIEQAHKHIEAAKARLSEIEQAEAKVVQAEAMARATVAELKEQLPALLAAVAMGEITPDICQIKGKIALAQEAIQDTPLALEGLKLLKRPELVKIREAQRVLSKLERYKKIHADLEAGGPLSGVRILRDLAKVLGFEKDTEAFIAGLPQMRGCRQPG